MATSIENLIIATSLILVGLSVERDMDLRIFDPVPLATAIGILILSGSLSIALLTVAKAWSAHVRALGK